LYVVKVRAPSLGTAAGKVKDSDAGQPSRR
jgi:hypothetical protein